MEKCIAEDPDEKLKMQVQLVRKLVCLDDSNLATRKRICQNFKNVLQPKFHVDIYQFGSSSNGLGFKGCDLDVFLDIPGKGYLSMQITEKWLDIKNLLNFDRDSIV